MKNEPKRLREFFDEFIDRHRIGNAEAFDLIVTEEECMRLGEFFIRGMVGWASGYDLVQSLEPSTSSPPLEGVVLQEMEPEDVAKEANEEEVRPFSLL